MSGKTHFDCHQNMKILFIFGSNFAKITPHSVYNSIEQCIRLLLLVASKKNRQHQGAENPRKVYRIFLSMKPPSNCIWQTSRIIKFIIVILWLEWMLVSCYHRRSFTKQGQERAKKNPNTAYNKIQRMEFFAIFRIGWLTLYRTCT